MAAESDIISKASEFVRSLFEERLADYLIYHTFDHTQQVTETARKIAEEMALGEEGTEVVELAALFHDAGYTELYKGHENVSMRIATEFLERENYPPEKIRLVTGCIRATQIPQLPKNILEEIVADADLSGFGKKSFFKKSDLLHLEWRTALGITNSEEEWARQNLEMLTGHTYFTRYAKKAFSDQKAENIRILYKKLSEYQEDKEIASPEPAPIPQYPEPRLFPEYVQDETVDFKGDKKAQTLIIINAIIVLILFTFILRKRTLPFDLRELIPVFLLLAVSVVTIFFAILAIRPDTESVFLDGEKRNRFLRISYTIFMYGVSASAATLTILSFVKCF